MLVYQRVHSGSMLRGYDYWKWLRDRYLSWNPVSGEDITMLVPYCSILFHCFWDYNIKMYNVHYIPRIQNMCVTDQTTSETINQHGIFYVL